MLRLFLQYLPYYITHNLGDSKGSISILPGQGSQIELDEKGDPGPVDMFKNLEQTCSSPEDVHCTSKLKIYRHCALFYYPIINIVPLFIKKFINIVHHISSMPYLDVIYKWSDIPSSHCALDLRVEEPRYDLKMVHHMYKHCAPHF